MGRYSRNQSYGHGVRLIAPDCYRISWTCDRYYASSRLRHPRTFTRETDAAGARRFCKKHGLTMPEPRS